MLESSSSSLNLQWNPTLDENILNIAELLLLQEHFAFEYF